MVQKYIVFNIAYGKNKCLLTFCYLFCRLRFRKMFTDVWKRRRGGFGQVWYRFAYIFVFYNQSTYFTKTKIILKCINRDKNKIFLVLCKIILYTYNSIDVVFVKFASNLISQIKIFRHELTTEELRGFERELQRLLLLGYRWSHAYTQCVLQAMLYATRNKYIYFSLLLLCV